MIAVALVLVAVAGTAVVLTADPARQAVSLWRPGCTCSISPAGRTRCAGCVRSPGTSGPRGSPPPRSPGSPWPAWLGGGVLANFLPRGTFQQLFSAGTVPVLNILVGFAVGAGAVVLLAQFLTQATTQAEED